MEEEYCLKLGQSYNPEEKKLSFTSNVMKKVYNGKWIDIWLREEGEKTNIYVVLTKNNDWLAEIKWFGQWRQYCLYPKDNTIWARSCLDEICYFINERMFERKKKLHNRGDTV